MDLHYHNIKPGLKIITAPNVTKGLKGAMPVTLAIVPWLAARHQLVLYKAKKIRTVMFYNLVFINFPHVGKSLRRVNI